MVPSPSHCARMEAEQPGSPAVQEPGIWRGRNPAPRPAASAQSGIERAVVPLSEEMVEQLSLHLPPLA